MTPFFCDTQYPFDLHNPVGTFLLKVLSQLMSGIYFLTRCKLKLHWKLLAACLRAAVQRS